MTLTESRELMKDVVIATIILFILTAIFSYGDIIPEQDKQDDGNSIECSGESMQIIPGEGDMLIQSQEMTSPLTGYF